MHQGGGLERLPGLLLSQLRRRQLAQRIVDQRQQLLGGVGVALVNGVQHTRHFVHGPHEGNGQVRARPRAGRGPRTPGCPCCRLVATTPRRGNQKKPTWWNTMSTSAGTVTRPRAMRSSSSSARVAKAAAVSGETLPSVTVRRRPWKTNWQ